MMIRPVASSTQARMREFFGVAAAVEAPDATEAEAHAPPTSSAVHPTAVAIHMRSLTRGLP